jgi:GDSL-like Lipase/Acylhydrolase family
MAGRVAFARLRITILMLALVGTALHLPIAGAAASPEAAATIAWSQNLGTGYVGLAAPRGPSGEVAIQACGGSAPALTVRSRSGALLWSKSNQSGYSYCWTPGIFDDSGNLYVQAGGPTGMLLRSFNVVGQLRWQRSLPLGGGTPDDGVILGSDGNVYVIDDSSFSAPHLKGFRASDGYALFDSTLSAYGDPPHTMNAYSGGLYLSSYNGPPDIYVNYTGSIASTYYGYPPEWYGSPANAPAAGGIRYQVSPQGYLDSDCSKARVARMTPSGLTWVVPYRDGFSPPCPSSTFVASTPGGNALILESNGELRLSAISQTGAILWGLSITPPRGEWVDAQALATDVAGHAVIVADYAYFCQYQQQLLSCRGTTVTTVDLGARTFTHTTLSAAPPCGIATGGQGLTLDTGRAYITTQRFPLYYGAQCNRTGHVFQAIDMPELGAGYLDALLHPYRSGSVDPVNYEALGDSYSSGQGNGPYDPDSIDSGCDRSPVAYARQFDVMHPEVLIHHFACNGAKILDVIQGMNGEPSQVGGLSDATNLVSITVGGNDVDFSRVMTQCAITADYCQTVNEPDITALILAQRPRLADLYTQMLAAAPNARIFVLGYPRLFPIAPFQGCTGMSVDEQGWINQKLQQLDDVINGAVADVGDLRLSFVAVEDAFTGKELCSSAPQEDQAMWGIKQPKSESFHPKPLGHELLAAYLGSAYA